jgi:hypothetical protein
VHSQSTAVILAGPVADPPNLTLERLPNGELAWLRPDHQGSDSRRVVLTQRGYDLLARWRVEACVFGREITAS